MAHPDVEVLDAILVAVASLRGRRTPHEVARVLRRVAQRLDDEPMFMVSGAHEFIAAEVAPRIPGGRHPDVVAAFLLRPDAAILPYRNARHALAAGDLQAMRDYIDALAAGGGA